MPLSLGRELIGGGDSLAVEAYRERLLSGFAIEPGKGKKALDLGCGDGLEAVYLARRGYRVLALDIERHPNWKRLERESKGLIRFRKADASKLKALRPGFDLVFEKDMLHHVDEPLKVLTEMKRLLKKGGTLHIAECNRYNPIFYVHLTLLGGHEHFSRGRLKALMDSAGLKGWMLRLREARVFPVESRAFQAFMNAVQELIERVRLLDPILCYNLASWTKRG